MGNEDNCVRTGTCGIDVSGRVTDFYCNPAIAGNCMYIEADTMPAPRSVVKCRCQCSGAPWCKSLRARAHALNSLARDLSGEAAKVEKDIRDGVWINDDNKRMNANGRRIKE